MGYGWGMVWIALVAYPLAALLAWELFAPRSFQRYAMPQISWIGGMASWVVALALVALLILPYGVFLLTL